ncbi:phosphatidylinositol-glycan biosynthesis class F protein [Euwallacea similis]|uniref:phosphatidylinositol-glycan biosynthesis class F protein n=1 Tax=Euwallacea similis TaxID=1736056 RepID=UPI0034510D86
MQFSSSNYIINPTNLPLNSALTCSYLSLLFLWCHFSDFLYQIGNFRSSYLQWILLIFEVVKYWAFPLNYPKDPKKTDPKRPGIFKNVFTSAALVAAFYAIAILFGAPFFSKQEETFTFALTMGVLTVLPSSLHLGPDKSASILLSLTSLNVTKSQKPFEIVAQLTCLGAWLGAVVIPLDWNKPYQVWPIPCILGALAGCFLGNFSLLFAHVFQSSKSKRKLRTEC